MGPNAVRIALSIPPEHTDVFDIFRYLTLLESHWFPVLIARVNFLRASLVRWDLSKLCFLLAATSPASVLRSVFSLLWLCIEVVCQDTSKLQSKFSINDSKELTSVFFFFLSYIWAHHPKEIAPHQPNMSSHCAHITFLSEAHTWPHPCVHLVTLSKTEPNYYFLWISFSKSPHIPSLKYPDCYHTVTALWWQTQDIESSFLFFPKHSFLTLSSLQKPD